MCRKVIFLDIDGVLINHESLKNGGNAHPDCVTLLNNLIRETGAVIVISSTWRKGDLKRVQNQLREWGVRGGVIGVTPEMERVSNGGVLVSAACGLEIQEWLDLHPGISSFVILDDESDMEHLTPYLVRTEYETGLTYKNILQAEKILRMSNNSLQTVHNWRSFAHKQTFGGGISPNRHRLNSGALYCNFHYCNI